MDIVYIDKIDITYYYLEITYLNNRYITMKCTLDQWRVFQAVVEKGGFAEAAEYLYKSQSTVSYTIQQLQEELVTPLFEKKGRRLELTKFGEIMLHRSRILLEDAVKIEKIAERAQGEWPAEILVIIDDPFPREVIAKALYEFKQISDTKVQLLEESLSGCIEYLEKDTADIVIAHRVPKGYIEFAQVKITQIAVASHASPLHLLPSPLTVDDLKREVQIVIADSGVETEVDKGWLDAPNRWRVSSSDIAVQLLLANIGFGWLPEHYVIPYFPKLKPISLQYAQKRSFFLNCLFGKKSPPNLAAVKFSECMQAVIKSSIF